MAVAEVDRPPGLPVGHDGDLGDVALGAEALEEGPLRAAEGVLGLTGMLTAGTLGVGRLLDVGAIPVRVAARVGVEGMKSVR